LDPECPGGVEAAEDDEENPDDIEPCTLDDIDVAVEGGNGFVIIYTGVSFRPIVIPTFIFRRYRHLPPNLPGYDNACGRQRTGFADIIPLNSIPTIPTVANGITLDIVAARYTFEDIGAADVDDGAKLLAWGVWAFGLVGGLLPYIPSPQTAAAGFLLEGVSLGAINWLTGGSFFNPFSEC